MLEGFKIEVTRTQKSRLKEVDFDELQEATDHLEFVKKSIGEWHFAGRPKSFNNDLDRNRRAVCKNIRDAIDRLIRHPETKHIGEHLKQHVKLGFSCVYLGKWRWIF